MAVTQELRTIPPLKITGLLQAKWANQVLKTAIELDLFSHLNGHSKTAGQLAADVQADERGVGFVLDALAAMELLTKKGHQYHLTDVAELYLVKDSHLYFGGYILAKDLIDESWSHLTETVRTGKPQARVNTQEEGEKFFRQLTINIFPINYTTAQMLAQELKVSSMSGAVQVLDLAAGSGVWSLPMAQCNKNVHVDALDFPSVLEVTRDFATKFGVEKQYSYLSGNWSDIKLEPEKYDFITLGHILHSEGKERSREMLKRCAASLKKGGKLIIAEFVENEERSGPLFPALFAVNMMLATSSGCVFTENELKIMLQEAGLQNAQRVVLPFWGDQSPLVAATK